MITAMQDCTNTLKRVGLHLRLLLQGTKTVSQRQSEPTTLIAQESNTCGCGKDTCQIGNSADACSPHKQFIVMEDIA